MTVKRHTCVLVTDADRAAVRWFHAEGLTDAQVAARMGCTADRAARVRRMLGLRAHRVRASPLLARRGLYDQGLSDSEIARREGCSAAAVTAWRRRLGLAPYYAPGRDLAIRLTLYRKGLTDQQIADHQGISGATVRSWRIKLGLAVNRSPDETHPVRLQLYRDGLSDVQIARRQGVAANSIGSWRRRRNLARNVAVTVARAAPDSDPAARIPNLPVVGADKRATDLLNAAERAVLHGLVTLYRHDSPPIPEDLAGRIMAARVAQEVRA
ncbi:hypothetical protein [Puniceibacterium sp. IMCC21224]|uniref:hypothetical protein n=1 Tax=Puniceibacterium sp. IMCC21224 TaxID=1618204 RepID=UPI00064DB506|nr:hypothetical protein [Puniceibacterium sp. IMCC21224]KMK63788.1 hypothetical protein IMCC21224_1923 [Puniceibacterium sp. IMCC21224]